MPTVRYGGGKTFTTSTVEVDDVLVIGVKQGDGSYVDYNISIRNLIGQNVESLKDLTLAANKGLYATAANTLALFDLTSAGRALLDDADAAAQRTTLGLGGLAILDPADLESGGSDELEIALSQIPSINSQAATFLAAATLLAQQQALDLEPTVDIPSLSQFTTLDNAAAKTADAESITGQWTFGNRVDLYTNEPGFFLGEADGTYGAYFVFNNDILQVQQRLKNFTSAVSFMKWNFPIPADSFIMQSATGNMGLGVATAAIAERIHAAGNCRISGAYKIDTNDVINSSRIFILRSYTVATLPSVVAQGLIYVSDDALGPCVAFSNGTNWIRLRDGQAVRAEASTADEAVRQLNTIALSGRRIMDIWCKSTSSYVGSYLVGSGVLVALNTPVGFTTGATSTTPTGMTGTDGNVTVYENSGIIYVENRSGGSLTFLCSIR